MITREKSEKNTLKLSVKISAEVWAQALEVAYEETKGKFNIQGFRKGKAPRKVIEKNYGDTIFYDEAFEHVVSKEYNDFLNANEDVNPVDYPHVTVNKITADGVEATLVVDLMPEVKLGKYEGIAIEKKAVKVTAAQVNAEVERLVNAHARYVESDSEAAMGDFATIDFSGSIEGVKFEGGTAEDFRLELGSHSFIDNFEEQICGMKVGDEKDITVKFPEQYPAKELAGKNAVFAIKVKKVEKKEVAEINDKFISDTTEFESLAEYKKDVKAKLVAEEEKKAQVAAEDELVKTIVESSEIELPNSMVEHEIDHIVEDLRRKLAYQQITLEQYLEFMKISMKEFRDTKREEAVRSLKTTLVLKEIVKVNNLEVTKEDYDNRLEEFATRSGKTVEEFDKEISDYERSYINNDILMTKLMNILKSKNEIK